MKKDWNVDKEEAGAQFNIGLSTAMEIRKLLNECNIYSRMGKFELWYGSLLTLQREISAEMKTDKVNNDFVDLKVVNSKAVAKLEKYDSSSQPKLRTEVFVVLHNLEVVIRTIIKRRGLGMPDKEDDDGL